jgi:flagellum-specific peptidoglycan hydrolase FlgJ
MTKDEFIHYILDTAVKIQIKHNLPAACLTAQACLETGYGKYICKDIKTGKYSYNLFNIKGTGTNGSVSVKTWEVYNGKKVNVIANFRAYNNFEESFEDYVKLIKKNSRYASAVAVGNDPEKYAIELKKCGYATDPQYSQKLISIMNQLNLKEKVTQLIKEKSKELINITIEEWQKQAGFVSIENLAKNGLLNNPEDWKKQIENNTPMWLFWVMLDRISNLKGGK